MAVKLALSEEDARLIWCRLARARKGMLKALDDQNMANAGMFFGWMDSELTKLAESAPDEVMPTGNETDKP